MDISIPLLAGRHADPVMVALTSLDIAAREAQDLVVGLQRMHAQAGLSVTLNDVLDVVTLVNTVHVRADAVVALLCSDARAAKGPLCHAHG